MSQTSRISEADLIINPDGSVYHLNIHPDQLCDKIIAVGDPDRVDEVSKYFDKIDYKIAKREFVTHVGSLSGEKIMVISSGIGTDNIDIMITELDALANIDFEKREVKQAHRTLNIIRIGTSGSMQADIPEGAALISNYGLGLDTLMSFYDLKQDQFEKEICEEVKEKTGLNFLPYCVQGSTLLRKQIGEGMILGNTVTCPGFYGPQGRKVRLQPKNIQLLDQLASFQKNDFRLTNFEMETAGYYGMGKLLGHEILSVNAIVANRITQKFAENSHEIVDDLIQKVLNRF
ncbi:nucleoside phosphorylase [Fulvivirgaceae bacterium LMO-SS25]